MTIDEIAKAAATRIIKLIIQDIGITPSTSRSEVANIIKEHFAPLAEQNDRLLTHLKHLLAYAVSNDPGDDTQGYTIRLDYQYRNTLRDYCEKGGKS